jgi:hypothetical protein
MPLNTKNAVNEAVDQQVKQDQFNPVRQPDYPDQDFLKNARIASIIGSGLDWGSTAYGLAKGGHEVNPLLQWAHDDPLKTSLAGAGLSALTGVLLERALKNHPKILGSIHTANAIGSSGMAFHNFGTPSKQDR